MITLYSAAVTVGGKKKRSVSFNLGPQERHALRDLTASVIAVNGLTPGARDLRCGARMSKEWCQGVAEGMTDLLGTVEEETLTLATEHIKALRAVHTNLGAILNGTTTKTKTLNINGKALSNLIAGGKALSAYENDRIDVISINGNSVTRTRALEAIKFLNSINRNVLIKSY